MGAGKQLIWGALNEVVLGSLLLPKYANRGRSVGVKELSECWVCMCDSTNLNRQNRCWCCGNPRFVSEGVQVVNGPRTE